MLFNICITIAIPASSAINPPRTKATRSRSLAGTLDKAHKLAATIPNATASSSIILIVSPLVKNFFTELKQPVIAEPMPENPETNLEIENANFNAAIAPNSSISPWISNVDNASVTELNNTLNASPIGAKNLPILLNDLPKKSNTGASFSAIEENIFCRPVPCSSAFEAVSAKSWITKEVTRIALLLAPSFPNAIGIALRNPAILRFLSLENAEVRFPNENFLISSRKYFRLVPHLGDNLRPNKLDAPERSLMAFTIPVITLAPPRKAVPNSVPTVLAMLLKNSNILLKSMSPIDSLIDLKNCLTTFPAGFRKLITLFKGPNTPLLIATPVTCVSFV